MRAHEVAHVLHHAQHRDADALEHLRAAQGIAHRDLLRRGHDDGGADMYRLGERELRVARPRRQVHEKVVELSPVHVLHELPDHLHNDGAAPDGRESRSTMSASDMSFTPWASSGWILPLRTSGFWSTPIIRGMFGP